MLKKLRFRLCLEWDIGIWLKLHFKIYFKRTMSFVCERHDFFLILSINVVFMCEFSWIEMSGVLGVRRKGVWIAKKVTVSFMVGVGVRCLG